MSGVMRAATETRTEMIKANWLAGLLALALFGNAQYQGWSLFGHEGSSQTARPVAGRGHHK